MQKQFDSISDEMCADTKKVFYDPNDYAKYGGLKSMSDALGRGMVLTMSIWVDYGGHMQWLDGSLPPWGTAPGNARGSCDPNSGNPDDIERNTPHTNVKYSNIKYGEIGSTFE